MNFNLNGEEFKSTSTLIFNNGEAGKVENVSISVEKKGPEMADNAPEYKVIFTDDNGGTCNSSFWYVTAPTEYATVDDQVQKQGKVLKHVIHAIYGANFQFPGGFTSATELLDGCMKLIRDGLQSGLKFRIFANYGVKTSIKKYIQPRTWVPFMEPMTVTLADTRLKAGDLDAMARVQEDSFVPSTGAANANDLVAGDEW